MCRFAITPFRSASYKRYAIKPAKTAPPDIVFATAPPVNTGGFALDEGVVELAPAATRVKLAQVRRVVLLLWMTMDRLPKKEPTPGCVEV